MDSNIGGSCYSLHNVHLEKDEKDNKELQEIITSTRSLTKYESKSWKSLYPQIFASILASFFWIGNGISLGYSSVLIAQLKNNGSDIVSTDAENSWIASVLILVAPPSSIIGGFLMDGFGRLNSIKIAAIPGVIGWVMIALAQNVNVIIIGRAFLGVSSAWGTSPGVVYVSEISNANVRGSLMSIAPIFVSLGMVFIYLAGWMIDWRTLAWLCNGFTIAPALMVYLIPESPAWLVLKGRNKEAEKGLEYLHKYQLPTASQRQTFAQVKLKLLEEEQAKKREQAAKGHKGWKAFITEFMKPTAYKPFIFLLFMFLFQHFSGIYITMFFSVQFIAAAGTNIDPFLASIFIGIVRLIMSVISTYLMKRYTRRTLVLLSTALMAACMFISGLFTKWIIDGTTSMTWVPVTSILLFVVSSIIGFTPIPGMLMAELFPLEIRGIAYSITYSIGCIFMFAALQSYYTLNELFGGASGLQWFFAVMSIFGMIYCYIFQPETFEMQLSDISEYFKYNTVYIMRNKKKDLGVCQPKHDYEEGIHLTQKLKTVEEQDES